MKLTPLDIQQQTFKVSFRGYDRVEVTDFLEAVRRDYEELTVDNARLRERLAELQSEVQTLRERETELQQCLVTAREMADDVVDKARRKAEIIEGEAQLAASKLMNVAQERAAGVKLELGDLQRQRNQARTQLRALLESQLRLLDANEDAAGHAATVEDAVRRAATAVAGAGFPAPGAGRASAPNDDELEPVTFDGEPLEPVSLEGIADFGGNGANGRRATWNPAEHTAWDLDLPAAPNAPPRKPSLKAPPKAPSKPPQAEASEAASTPNGQADAATLPEGKSSN